MVIKMKYKQKYILLITLIVNCVLLADLKNYALDIKDSFISTVEDRTEFSINSFDNEFDENYWMEEISENSDPNLSNVTYSIINDPVFEGSGSMQLDYSVHNIESWGGYAKIFHMHPDVENGGVYDWSDYNTISFTYYNASSTDVPGVIEFRFNLSDYAEIDDAGYNGLGEYYYSFHQILDSEPGWNTIDIPLSRNDSWDGSGFNLTGWAGDAGNGVLETHAIGGFHFEFAYLGGGEGNSDGGTIIFDDLGLKNVDGGTDTTPPDAPGNLFVINDNYFNVIMWDDVPNEEGEIYRIFASENPDGEDAEVVAVVGENVSSTIHRLYSPLEDQNISYYYAIECVDSWGNVSDLNLLESSFTNLARGIPVLSSSMIPNNPVADGDLTEWTTSGIQPFEVGSSYNSWGTPRVTWGTVDGDEDLFGTIYMAIDENNLYVAAHIQDDNYVGFIGDGNWWEHDAFELFLGLYDQQGERHWQFERGDEPDYQFLFFQDYAVETQNGFQVDSGSEHYTFAVDGSSYVIEAIYPLDQIAGGNDLIYQFANGDKIPIEPTIHDNDGNGREGTLACSPLNFDNAWQTPYVWSSTFVYPTEINTSVSIHSSEEYVIHGDTVLVGIHIDDIPYPLSSISISFDGFVDKMNIVDILLDDESLMGAHDWAMEYNADTPSGALITASAGAQDIDQSGRLFSIKFAVHDTMPSQIIDVNPFNFIGNEDLTTYEATSGGVNVLWLPEAGFVSDVTSGMYPLTVNFSDTSIQGTYPIVDVQWDFGNGEFGEGESVSTSYERPGFYNVTLSVIDEFGLTDTMHIENYISVDTLYGDVDFSSNIDLMDAFTILENTVELVEFDSLTQSIADLTVNGSISNLDASFIMQYLYGYLDSIPHNPGNEYDGSGEIVLEDQNADPGMMIYIPVQLENANNIYGFTGMISFDPTILSIDTLSTSDNYMGAANLMAPGEIMVSVAGALPFSDSSSVFTIGLYVNENFSDETTLSITNFSWNENDMVDTAATMTIGFGLSVDESMIPLSFQVYQNYPNPFNPSTNISYDLPENSFVSISIFDMMGRTIKEHLFEKVSAGRHSINWNGLDNNGSSVSAGVYFYSVRTKNNFETKKMILLK